MLLYKTIFYHSFHELSIKTESELWIMLNHLAKEIKKLRGGAQRGEVNLNLKDSETGQQYDKVDWWKYQEYLTKWSNMLRRTLTYPTEGERLTYMQRYIPAPWPVWSINYEYTKHKHKKPY